MSNLMQEVNNMAWKPEDFASEVCCDHRTLQQQFGGAVLLILQRWATAYDTGQYDLRNEAICHKASIMVKALEDAGEPLSVPFI